MGEQIKIIPYMTVDGVPTFKDSDIIEFYNRMVKDKTAELVFQDGSISSADEFLNTMRGPGCFLAVVYWQGEPVALGWANRFQGKVAQVHFCTFSEFWGERPIIPECGRRTCIYLMDALELDGLFGLVPEKNKKAIAVTVEAGGKIIGKLPMGSYNKYTGKSETAVILSYTREGNEDDHIF